MRDDVEDEPAGERSSPRASTRLETRVSKQGEPALDTHHHRGADDERCHDEPQSDAIGYFLQAVDDRAFVDDFDLQLELTARERLEHAIDPARQLLGELLRLQFRS